MRYHWFPTVNSNKHQTISDLVTSEKILILVLPLMLSVPLCHQSSTTPLKTVTSTLYFNLSNHLHRIERLPTMRDVTIQVLFIPNSQISISMATLQLEPFIFN